MIGSRTKPPDGAAVGRYMHILWDWLRRIIQIGILDFLRSLGWRVWAGLLLGAVVLVALVIILLLLVIALI